jgi:hypothetical protein
MISRTFGMGASLLTLFVRLADMQVDGQRAFLLVMAGDSLMHTWIPATISDPTDGDDTTYCEISPCSVGERYVFLLDDLTDRYTISPFDMHSADSETIRRLSTRRYFWTRDELVPGRKV